jgi:hypothetical protein
MPMKCNYHYREGLCANSLVQSPFCVGDGRCPVVSKAEKEDAGNSLKSADSVDELSQWLGLYCPHYQRFYCTGEGTGCKTGACATPDEYNESLAKHMEKVK